MSADYAAARSAARARCHEEPWNEVQEALDELDRLRSSMGQVWGSDCIVCGNATPDSQVCDACDSDEHTVRLYWNPPPEVSS